MAGHFAPGIHSHFFEILAGRGGSLAAGHLRVTSGGSFAGHFRREDGLREEEERKEDQEGDG